MILQKAKSGDTHILVTHGDPDHYWHVDRVAEAANAPVICNKTLVRNINGGPKMLGPRDKGLAFTKSIKKLHTISVDETIKVDGISAPGEFEKSALNDDHGESIGKMYGSACQVHARVKS